MTALTPREREAIDLLVNTPSLTNKDIAALMGVNTSTVGVFLAEVARKYGVQGRTAASHAHRDARELETA